MLDVCSGAGSKRVGSKTTILASRLRRETGDEAFAGHPACFVGMTPKASPSSAIRRAPPGRSNAKPQTAVESNSEFSISALP